LGKHSACDVVLDDGRVSRRHARLRAVGAELLLEDLGSTNGTEVGGRSVEGERAIGPADDIVIGPFHVVARLAEATVAETPPAPPGDFGTVRLATAPAAMPHPATQLAATPLPAEASDSKLGPLAPLANDDSVTEIMVNGPGEVFVEREGRLELTDVR